jgi:hypothetical protein
MKAPQRVIIENDFSGILIVSNIGTEKFCSYSQFETLNTLIIHQQLPNLKYFEELLSYWKALCTAPFKVVRIDKKLIAILMVFPLKPEDAGKVLSACVSAKL